MNVPPRDSREVAASIGNLVMLFQSLEDRSRTLLAELVSPGDIGTGWIVALSYRQFGGMLTVLRAVAKRRLGEGSAEYKALSALLGDCKSVSETRNKIVHSHYDLIFAGRGVIYERVQRKLGGSEFEVFDSEKLHETSAKIGDLLEQLELQAEALRNAGFLAQIDIDLSDVDVPEYDD